MKILEMYNKQPVKKRETGHEEAITFLDKLHTLDNVAVRMTEMPKLGINPTSSYSTPVGLCFYPADYYYDTITSSLKLPFQHDAHYIQIFKYNTNKILAINEFYSNNEAQDILNKLSEFNDNFLDSYYNINELWEESKTEAIQSHTIGGRLWYIMFVITRLEQNPALTWHKLLKKYLDNPYDVILDNGGGIIHKNEPVQGLILNPTVVKQLTQIEQHYQFKSGIKHIELHHFSVKQLVSYAIAQNKRLPPDLEKTILETEKAYNISDVMLYFKVLVRKPWKKFEDIFLYYWQDENLIRDYFMITRQPISDNLIRIGLNRNIYNAIKYALFVIKSPLNDYFNKNIAKILSMELLSVQKGNKETPELKLIQKYITTYYPQYTPMDFVKLYPG